MSPVTYTYAGKKPKMTAQNPYDYGQEALYPGGYQGTPNPVDMSTFFTGGGGAQYAQPAGGGGGGGAGGVGGAGNAYADLINRMLNQQRADFAGESAADKASRDAQIKRVLVSYGAVPDISGVGGEAGNVLQGLLGDEKLRGLIEQNTAEGTSIKARQEQANALAQRRIGQGTARQGLLRSGETGYQQGQQEMAHKQTSFDTLSQALGEIEGSVGTYAANERQRQRMLADAEMQAQMNAFRFADDTQMTYGDPNAGGGGMYPEGGPQPGQPYGGVTDPYWQNLINYYEGAQTARQQAAARAKAEAQRRAQANARINKRK